MLSSSGSCTERSRRDTQTSAQAQTHTSAAAWWQIKSLQVSNRLSCSVSSSIHYFKWCFLHTVCRGDKNVDVRLICQSDCSYEKNTMLSLETAGCWQLNPPFLQLRNGHRCYPPFLCRSQWQTLRWHQISRSAYIHTSLSPFLSHTAGPRSMTYWSRCLWAGPGCGRSATGWCQCGAASPRCPGSAASCCDRWG